MADWVRIYGVPGAALWGWKVPQGPIKARDLPEDMRGAVERRADSLRPLQIEKGRLQAVKWVQAHPLDWPEAVATDIQPGSYVLDVGGEYVVAPSSEAA